MLDRAKTNLDRVSFVLEAVAAQHGVASAILPDDSLVDRGVTSMAMVDLMLALEVEFDVTIPQSAMTLKNFQSARSLAAMMDHLVA